MKSKLSLFVIASILIQSCSNQHDVLTEDKSKMEKTLNCIQAQVTDTSVIISGIVTLEARSFDNGSNNLHMSIRRGESSDIHLWNNAYKEVENPEEANTVDKYFGWDHRNTWIEGRMDEQTTTQSKQYTFELEFPRLPSTTKTEITNTAANAQGGNYTMGASFTYLKDFAGHYFYPGLPAGTYKVVCYKWYTGDLHDGDNQLIYDEPLLEFCFTIDGPGPLIVNAPSIGEIYRIGQQTDFDWSLETTTATTSSVYYSINHGAWQPVPNGTVQTNYVFLTLPNTITTDYRIRVTNDRYPNTIALYEVASPSVVLGPAVTVSGPSSLNNGKGNNFTVSTSPSGYTNKYQWFKSDASTGWQYEFKGETTSPSYWTSVNGSSFHLRVDAYFGDTKMGSGYKSVTCTNCGGIEP